MIITTIEELRLHSPAHALDSIDSLVGFIDNSEHDFLEEKLGTPLYQHLQAWYDENQALMSQVSAPMIGDTTLPPYNRLCLLAQRCVAFDALGRAIGMQVVSVNNSGVNQMVTDDYVAPDKNGKTIEMYRDTCNREAHAAVNQLLRQLELWCKMSGDRSLAANNGEAETDARDLSPDIYNERKEICELWKQSAYYYQAAALIIPSCEVLQRYLNIYDSREKFIQLLPDMQFIQEEIIGNAIGEELLQVVVDFARDGKLPADDRDDRGQVPGSPQADENAPARDLSPVIVPPISEATLGRLLHRLRKVMAALLVGRTSVLKYTKEQKVQAHDDGVRMLQNVVEYIKQNIEVQVAVTGAQASTSGESEAPAAPTGGAASGCSPCHHGKPGEPRDAKPEAACWTPPLL